MDVQNESSLTRGDIFYAGVKKGEKWDFIHLQQDTGRGDKTLTCAHCVYTIFPCVMTARSNILSLSLVLISYLYNQLDSYKTVLRFYNAALLAFVQKKLFLNQICCFAVLDPAKDPVQSIDQILQFFT